MRSVSGALLGDGGCDGAERCIAFALEENCAEGTMACCDARGADEWRGRGAECRLGIGIEAHRIGGEAEFGGEGREGGVGAGGGDEGREGFEGAHAANVAGEVAASGCEIVRGGAKDCVLGRRASRMRSSKGNGARACAGAFRSQVRGANSRRVGAEWWVPNREMQCDR